MDYLHRKRRNGITDLAAGNRDGDGDGGGHGGGGGGNDDRERGEEAEVGENDNKKVRSKASVPYSEVPKVHGDYLIILSMHCASFLHCILTRESGPKMQPSEESTLAECNVWIKGKKTALSHVR